MTESSPTPDPSVRQKLKLIEAAKAKYHADFERMRRNMEFVAGYQWDKQANLDDPRYRVNLTLRAQLSKVAQLYAKNPKTEVRRKRRLFFQLWDGDLATIDQMFERSMAARSQGVFDMEADAVIQDFIQGRQAQQLVDRVADTMEILDEQVVSEAKPEYKEQMKQLVTRVVVCGIGYLRQNFVRAGSTSPLSTTETLHSAEDLARRAVAIQAALQEENATEEDPRFEELRVIQASLSVAGQQEDSFELSERIEFDFIPATSVIPDTRCRNLKEFVNARWVAIEYDLPLAEVNEFFGLQIPPGGGVKEFTHDGRESLLRNEEGENEQETLVRVYEFLNYEEKSVCFLLEGWGDYLRPPLPVEFPVSGFWPLIGLTFNAIENDPNTKAGLFPPSDVDLMFHPQKEWNRERDALRDQRNANAPKYLTRKGVLTDADKDRLQTAVPNQVIELEGVPADMPLDKAVVVMQVARIDPAVYDTSPLSEDIMLSTGQQEANLGPAQPNVTATVGTIAEQSRMTVSASNVDDLNGFLSRAAKMRGELYLQGMSEETVKRVVGEGAVWPTLDRDRQEFLKMLHLDIKAGSSGKPNQAIRVANFERIAPVLLQSGANPYGVIEEALNRLDDDLPLEKFRPIALPAMGQQPQKPNQPLQKQEGMSPVPLAAA